MKKVAIIVLILVMTSVFVNAEETSTEDLEKKIEELETELEKLRIEVSESNPLQSGETRDWAKGWFFQGFTTGEDHMSADVGYSIVLENFVPFWEEEYLEGRSGYRLAFSLGAETANEVVIDADKQDMYTSEWLAANASVHWGTPVMLNFISFNVSTKFMFMFSTEDDDKNIKGNDFGISVGTEGEIWLSSKSAIVVGFRNDTVDFEDNKKSGRRGIIKDNFYPTFGFRKFF